MDYKEKSTQELIELLSAEEDRVTLEHIQELAARPDAVDPLRAWMRDERRWREARDGEWWALYHAFTILSLTRRPELLDDLLQGNSYAHEEDFDWLIQIEAAAFAQFGEAAVEPLIGFILSKRDDDDFNIGFLRAGLALALARIALENPAAEARIAEFFCSRFSDPEETEPVFLGSITGHAIMLDKEQALEPMRAAFERGVVDESIAGDFEETLKWFDPIEQRDDWEYHEDLLKFYQPQEIADRQARWKKEKEDEERREKQREANNMLRRPGSNALQAAPIVPEGYSVSDSGSFIREEKIGRNEPCPCGSGKKYKKCHGQ
ncbi:MAG TPA: SEC-C metal-binding domain-containing protein [Blastocatellia bacterium]|nr:SEC-C metal-binding domain-containing protein [Blastocatellia bacterium]HMV82292.1 SEC-C metal-binding domain-containing protein [Blastocatellia bacterium]HMX27261.1 SEC-C metal-binding domain-containing protein [Blastocatellia bacterium]HNG29508.1 SEC-C metal-binding domain-containing protein [Blastocatellia bacterium]